MYKPPFEISDEMLTLVSEISETIGKLTANLGDSIPHPMLRKQNRIKTIQSSLAIENNSLSIDQVTAIVEGRRVLGPPDDILEVQDAITAYEMLQDLNPYKESDLLKAHKQMMQGLVRENGKYRSGGVGVFSDKGCVHLAPPAERVPELMGDLFKWVKTTKTHPLVASCVFHYEFEFIHPFADGNGRMGRMWQTALLSKWKHIFAWIPVETIVKEHQQDYYDAIARCDHEGNSNTFILFMLGCLKDAVNKYELGDKLGDKLGERAKLLGERLSDRRVMMLQLMYENPFITTAELAQQMGVSTTAIDNNIRAMRDKFVRYVGKPRSGKWEIILEG